MPRPRKEVSAEEALARIERQKEYVRVRNGQLYRESEEFRRKHIEGMKRYYEANKEKYKLYAKAQYERRKALKAQTEATTVAV